MKPVRVERMINSRRVHTVDEPVPFRAAPLTQCGEHGVCLSHKDCPDVGCEDHPANPGEPMANEWAGAVLWFTGAVWAAIFFVAAVLAYLLYRAG